MVCKVGKGDCIERMVCKVGKGECIERVGWSVRWIKVGVLRGWGGL